LIFHDLIAILLRTARVLNFVHSAYSGLDIVWFSRTIVMKSLGKRIGQIQSNASTRLPDTSIKKQDVRDLVDDECSPTQQFPAAGRRPRNANRD
jgi:hypothetical protein